MTARDRRVLRVALTGGIATGKTYVRQLFEQFGVPTIDADVLSRHAVAPGTVGLQRVTDRFGRDILDADGALNRRKLGAIVFADEGARTYLEGIVHPYVQQATDAWFASLDPEQHPFAIDDIPLLFEAHREKDFDIVIVAAVDPVIQRKRVMERDGLSEQEARRRIDAQIPIEEKVKRADYVIRTGGSFEDTERQVQQVFESLRAKSSTTHHRLPTTD